jgi:hypothetical protein
MHKEVGYLQVLNDQVLCKTSNSQHTRSQSYRNIFQIEEETATDGIIYHWIYIIFVQTNNLASSSCTVVEVSWNRPYRLKVLGSDMYLCCQSAVAGTATSATAPSPDLVSSSMIPPPEDKQQAGPQQLVLTDNKQHPGVLFAFVPLQKVCVAVSLRSHHELFVL